MNDKTERPTARPIFRAVMRGIACRCPQCGRGHLYVGFLKTVERCNACGLELSHHRADDAPPYFTMLIVGHVVVALVLFAEITYSPPVWLHMVLWLPLTLILSLVLMRPIKGAIIGVQWALQMHGFSPESDPSDDRAAGHVP